MSKPPKPLPWPKPKRRPAGLEIQVVDPLRPSLRRLVERLIVAVRELSARIERLEKANKYRDK